MKKIMIGAVLYVATTAAWAVAPGGAGCGWGNMLWEGKSGPAPHFLAGTTNGSSGNGSFGMTSGTNGCSVDGRLTYHGEPMFFVSGMLDELTEDMARGEGEALTTLAVILGVAAEDRGHFASLTHEHFAQIVPDETVTAEQVLASIERLMREDQRLAKYVS